MSGKCLLPVLTISMLALVAPQLVSQNGAPLPIGQVTQFGSIEGVLTRTGTSEPIVGAAISLSGGANSGISQAQAQAIVDSALVQVPEDIFSTAFEGTPNFRFQAGATDPFSQPTTVTDNAGRFTISNLVPGPYAVRAQLEGYFGPALSNGIGANVTVLAAVNAQRVSRVALSLTPGAVISGRVVDTQGIPVTGRGVSAFRVSYLNGYKSLQGLAGGRGRGNQTNDRGEYRLFSLPPGEYFVSANPQPQGGGRAPIRAPVLERPVQTFYPSMIDVAGATSIILGGGGEAANINISVRNAPVVRISGRIASDITPTPSATPTARGARGPTATVRLVQRERPLTDPTLILGTDVILGSPVESGFEIQDVIAPGAYDLYAFIEDPQGYGPGPNLVGQPRSYGRTLIDVGTHDLNGVLVVIRRGVELRGRVTVDGSPAASAGMQILLQPDDSSARLAELQVASRTQYTAGADGSFTISSVPEGRYRFQVGVNGPSPLAPPTGPVQTVFRPLRDGYLADVLLGGASVYESGLVISDTTPSPVEIVVRTNSGSVEGIVTNIEGKPVGNARVVLAPPPSRHEILSLFKAVNSDANGHFSFENVAPGDYRLFAWELVEFRAYEVPEFLSKYESRGRSVSVEPNRSTNAQITVIPR